MAFVDDQKAFDSVKNLKVIFVFFYENVLVNNI